MTHILKSKIHRNEKINKSHCDYPTNVMLSLNLQGSKSSREQNNLHGGFTLNGIQTCTPREKENKIDSYAKDTRRIVCYCEKIIAKM